MSGSEEKGKGGGGSLESHYKELEGQIESLMKCTPLPEGEVKALCEKAREILQVLFPMTDNKISHHLIGNSSEHFMFSNRSVV